MLYKKLIWAGCRDGSVCSSAGLCKPEDISSNCERPGRKAASTSPEWAQVDSGGLLASQPNWNNELLTQWESLTFGTEAENKASGVFLCSQRVHAQMPVPCAHIHINTFEHFHLATCLVLLFYKDHTISSLIFQYFNFCTDTSFFFIPDLVIGLSSVSFILLCLETSFSLI